MKSARHMAMGALGVVVLVAVFYLYTQPDFLVQMANQLWACF